MAEASVRARAAADVPPAESSRFVTVLVAAALAGEILLFVLAAMGLLQGYRLLGLHLVIVAALAVGAWRPMTSGSDGGIALLAVVTTLCVGPFGAASALVLPLLARGREGDIERLDAWYERIALSAAQDDLTTLSDRIAIGRAANLAAPPPVQLAAEFATGSVTAQQTALGLIARNFDPAYLPILAQALDSPEPVIRVQAAAVAARVRDILRRQMPERLARAVEPPLSPAQALAHVASLEATVQSGLLESATAHDARRIADGLRARTLAGLDTAAQQRGVAPSSRAAAEAYLTYLLAKGRLSDFRHARAHVRAPFVGRYRRRRITAGRKIYIGQPASAGARA